jgi:hypothetical protein
VVTVTPIRRMAWDGFPCSAFLRPTWNQALMRNYFTLNGIFGYPSGTRERRMIQPMNSDSCSYHSTDQREVTEA